MIEPIAKVEVAPFDDPTNFTEIAIAGGHISRDMFQLAATFEFSTVQDYNLYANDYASFADWLLQRGAFVRVTCTGDGLLSGGNQKIEFYGKVWTWTATGNSRSGQSFSYVSRDPLYAAQHCGVNLAAATAQKVIEVTAQYTDFDDEFVLNIPLDSESEGFDYVPKQLLYIATSSYTNDDGDTVIKDYGESEYVYLAGRSQIVFTQSQQDLIDFGMGPNPVTWTIKRLYYDPDDETWTVKSLIMAMLTGDPYSYEGGLGLDHSIISLDEIVSFNGFSAKKVRSLFHDKPDAPISQVLDRLRDEGLLPYNYWLRWDADLGMVIGSYQVQDNSSTVDLNGTPRRWTRHTAPCTLDGIVGIVENYSQEIFPQNYAAGAPVTLTGDAGFLASYAIVGDEDHTVDSDGSSFIQFQREPALIDDPPQGSPRDLLTIDLCSQTGAPDFRDIRRVVFRGSAPKEHDGDDFIDIPNYYERNQPRITIVGSLDPITSSNPGNPVSSQAINTPIGISTVSETFDIDVECDLFREFRYLGIVFEQEGHFRRTKKKLFGSVKRMGYMGISEIGAYGNEWMRYPDNDPDAGRVPYARITNDAAAISSSSDSTHFNIAIGAAPWITVNSFIQVNRAGTVHLVQVTGIAPSGGFNTYTITPAVSGMTAGDELGYRKRWILGISGILHDTYLPKLFQKFSGGGEQQEQITSGEAGSIEEAEALCADRLFALWSISHDHEVDCLYDKDVYPGATVSADDAYLPFLVNRVDIALGSGKDLRPPVTMTLQGTNYEEYPE